MESIRGVDLVSISDSGLPHQTRARWTSLVRENLSSSRLPRTVVAACFLLALSCYLRYACRIACPIEDAATSCSDEERRSSSSEDPLKAWR